MFKVRLKQGGGIPAIRFAWITALLGAHFNIYSTLAMANSQKIITCVKPGKYAEPGDETTYHVCFYQWGQLVHLVRVCPTSTCFNQKMHKCHKSYCRKGTTTTTTTAKPDYTQVPYNCKEKHFDCTGLKKESSVHAYPPEPSVYFKCVKVNGTLQGICFHCSPGYCFNNFYQQCIPNPSPDMSCKEAPKDPFGTNPPQIPTGSYDCNVYAKYEVQCNLLSAGKNASSFNVAAPGDNSVYFHCYHDSAGNWIYECKTCSKKDQLCFSDKFKKCTKNCNVRPPFDCTKYDDSISYICQTGNAGSFFTNPMDTSVILTCLGNKQIACYTCHNKIPTCYSNTQGACVTYTNSYKNVTTCPSLEVIDSGKDPATGIGNLASSLTRDCSGYNAHSFPCDKLKNSKKKYAHPGDKSVYFTCSETNGKWVSTCEVCGNGECFNQEVQQCITCDVKEPGTPYDCSTYSKDAYHCQKSGYFSNPNDTSIYFKCVKKLEGGFVAYCFTCNSKYQTCYDDAQGGCVTNDGKSCGSKEGLHINSQKGTLNSSRTFDCDGYFENSLACGAYPEGNTALPGDMSVYFTCKKDKDGKNVYVSCASCSKETNSCFSDSIQQCVEDCGKETPTTTTSRTTKPTTTTTNPTTTTTTKPTTATIKPTTTAATKPTTIKTTKSTTTTTPKPDYTQVSYNCKEKHFDCTGLKESSVHAYPPEPSVYFKCVKVNGILQGICFHCSPGNCFNNFYQQCIPNPTPDMSCKDIPKNQLSTKPPQIPTGPYDCKGYSGYEVQCALFGKNSTSFNVAAPGDNSVYFHCHNDSTGNWIYECKTCSKKDQLCFSDKFKKCTTKCNVHPPFDCTKYDEKTIADICASGSAGKIFTNPLDTSVIFRCLENNQGACYTCNNRKPTCYSLIQSACVSYNNSFINATNCPTTEVIDNGQDPTATIGNLSSSLTRNCSGYNSHSFPCEKFKNSKKHYAHPGDMSVFFTCSQTSGKWVAHCKVCGNGECFNEEVQHCLTCDIKEPVKPYDCSTYSKEAFKCEVPGNFANPNDTSIYFRCVVKPDGGFDSYCLTCSSQYHTCYDDAQGGCVTNDENPCGTTEDLHNNQQKGTLNSSRTFDCGGYVVNSFPCKAYPEGTTTALPGDTSVYFTCKKDGNGNIHLSCETCPQETNSCFIDSLQQCVENCGKGPPTTTTMTTTTTTTPKPTGPYDCTRKQFTCKREGLFGYPQDTSIYFKCVKSGDTWRKYCYACNSVHETCFDEQQKACVANPKGEKCGSPSDIASQRGKANDSLTYDCNGYNDHIFPCASHSSGFHAVPGDKSVYAECSQRGAKVEVTCHTCPESTKSCYSSKTGKCEGNCYGVTPYDCSYYRESRERFKCKKVGFFASPDKTVYFNCVKRGESLYWYCYTCDKNLQTCFNENGRRCDKCPPGSAGGKCYMCTPWNPGDGDMGKPMMAYNCAGYSNQSFPCEKLISERKSGPWVMPGDHSLYFDCAENNGVITADCKACPETAQSCFISEKNRCIENCGNPLPYNCSLYTDKSHNCKKEGVVSNPKDASVYFKCVKRGYKWEVQCFSCKNHTCFNQALQTCQRYDGKDCEGFNNSRSIEVNGTSLIVSLSHSCKGYKNESFPCAKVGAAGDTNWHVVPGDKSLYFKCVKRDGHYVAECQSCPKATHSCYVEKEGKCIDNCGEGPTVNGTSRPYDCSGYHEHSYPCTDPDKHYRHPKDPTVFFYCLKEGNNFISLCYTCNSESRSCFDKEKNRCVKNCTNGTDLDPIPGESCKGFGSGSIPCANLVKDSNSSKLYPHLADPTVYFECVKQNESSWVGLCHKCPISTCFNKEEQICLPGNCNAGNPGPSDPDPGTYRPYDCNFYKVDAYPCQQEGTFVNPVDTSIYFQCVKGGKGLRPICYTCNSQMMTCYNQTTGVCSSTSQKECGNIHTLLNTTAQPNPYDCTGYKPAASIPCKQLGHAGIFPFPGDTSAYFECVLDATGNLTGKCKTCNKKKKACFNPETLTCVDYCILKPYNPNDCSIYNSSSFTCEREGYFAQIYDSSVFFQCVKGKNGLTPHCYTCDSLVQSCFSNSLQSCVKNLNPPCSDSDPATNTTSPSEIPKTHSCEGFNAMSIPCSLHKGGKHGTLADSTVYFTCPDAGNGDQSNASCTACPAETKSCFIEDKKDCVDNCGKGPHQPYNCSTYDQQSFVCEKEGVFAGNDSTIYFKCIKAHGKFDVHCYTCNSVVGSCFSEGKRACVACGKNDTSEGDDKQPVLMAHSCNGYSNFSFPCAQLISGGKMGPWVPPGDKSVYFDCAEKDDVITAICTACSNSTKSCFIKEKNRCIENCGRGPDPASYNCSLYTDKSYNCKKEGVFVNPKDASIYFKCVKRGDKWEVQCFSCKNHTCFNQTRQTCQKYDGKDCVGFTNSTNNANNGTSLMASLSHSCQGYTNASFPCAKIGAAGDTNWHNVPGDRSLYFKCVKKNYNFIADCQSCPSEIKACYIEQEKQCVANCGAGLPYNCTGRSYPCIREGFFTTSGNPTVFFHCKKVDGKFKSFCYSCNNQSGSCYVEEEKRCVPECNKQTPSEAKLNQTCDGYGVDAVPCADYMAGVTSEEMYLAHFGDSSVYFRCILQDQEYIAYCHKCPPSSCYYDAKKRLCVHKENCATKPYSCSQYNDQSYNCSKEGVFVNPKDASVYFKCIRKSSKWEVQCFTCKIHTCFNQTLQTCQDDDGADCFGFSNSNNHSGRNSSPSLSYSCNGYTDESFPCKKLGAAGDTNWHVVPADKSLFFRCVKKSGHHVAECRSCPKATQSCYVEKEQNCVPKCGDGYQPYECSEYTTQSYPCTKEGVFVYPEDATVFFHCRLINGKWKSLCYACNTDAGSCYKEDKKMCIPDCSNQTISTTPDLRQQTCDGYGVNAVPCNELTVGFKGEELYLEHLGDPTVYFRCIQIKTGAYVAYCHKCPPGSCFHPTRRICVPKFCDKSV